MVGGPKDVNVSIGENLLINAVMKASEGRLTPFQPLADDDGLDVLFFDKLTVPITVTVTICTGLPYPFTAASIRAISIFPIVIIASNARFATAGSG